MADITRTRTVTAPQHTVWDILADFGALSSWMDSVDHSCVLRVGPGGQPLGTVRRVQLGANVLVEQITEFDPPTTLAYDAEGLPARLGKLANRWTLRPDGENTLVTLTSTLKIGKRPPARLAEQVLLRFMARQSEALLAGLAHRLETTHV
ncbi:SRPBCC family protein [Mycobacterium asiaticum]|uniref:Cyclase n=1 Tax=Mycobacterium asiaticum TaxID=1790 RepID=A0A1A3MW82_MYCAS|nr:SRPBCC family protein [Mycobacterium asiaticum]OBK13330.1 cyclase [Mycobacterium asiaticum]